LPLVCSSEVGCSLGVVDNAFACAPIDPYMYGSRRQKQEHKPHPWQKKKPEDSIKKGTIDLQCTIAAEYGSACPSPLSLKLSQGA
jgi:hypothetical protein